VHGTHTYQEEGNFTVTVSVSDSGGSMASISNTTFSVADAALSSAGIVSRQTASDSQRTDPKTAVKDDNLNGMVSDFFATMNWGDGNTSTASGAAGTIVANGSGGFDVHGTHTYQEEGSFTVTVTVSDSDGSNTTISNTSFTIADAALSSIDVGSLQAAIEAQP